MYARVFVRNYHVRAQTSEKTAGMFFFFRRSNQFYVSNYSPLVLPRSNVSPHIGIKLRILSYSRCVNVSLPSSIAETIYFDLDQCLSGIFFKLRFRSLELYSRICIRVSQVLLLLESYIHRTNPTSI